jgi:hypothetical protein
MKVRIEIMADVGLVSLAALTSIHADAETRYLAWDQRAVPLAHSTAVGARADVRDASRARTRVLQKARFEEAAQAL